MSETSDALFYSEEQIVHMPLLLFDNCRTRPEAVHSNLDMDRNSGPGSHERM